MDKSILNMDVEILAEVERLRAIEAAANAVYAWYDADDAGPSYEGWSNGLFNRMQALRIALEVGQEPTE